MVNVKVTIDKSKTIQIEIKGHAKYAKHGKDIVCAAVSSISIVTVNAIGKFNTGAIEIKDEDGYLKIKVLSFDNITSTLLENMLENLSSLEKDYPKYIKIVFKEV